MQKKQIIVTLFFCVVCIMTNAQVLNGYVKTKGRKGENGVVIPGKRLAGVVIRIVGSINPVISKEDGSFSLNMPTFREGDSFRILSIRKNGYELSDKDLIGRKMVFSSRVPIYITMVDSQQFNEDKKRIKENVYKNAEKNYKQKLSSLEEQLRDGIITSLEYKKELEITQEQFEKSLMMIEDMADRYARTDFDYLNEAEQELYSCIENGDFERADSLSKILFDPIEALARNRANKDDFITKLNKTKTELEKQQDKDAEILYQLYTYSLAKLDYDKARYYIELRAELDSAKIDWQIDAGNYIVNYIQSQNNEDKAMAYFKRAFNCSKEKTNDRAYVYLSIGNLYYEQGNYRQAQDNYNLALDNFSKDDEGYAQCIERLAVVYNSMKRYSEAEHFHKLAIELYSKLFGENNNTVAYCYNNIGVVYENLKDYQNSEECYSKAINIWKQIYGENYSSTSVAVCYNNLGGIYDKMKDYNKAIDYYQKSLDTYKASGINPERNINIACVYNNLGSTYYNMSDYVNALNYYGKAIKIMRFTRDINHPDVRAVQENIAVVVGEMSQ